MSPRGSLYYAGEACPYDLEMLWQHVRDASGERDGDDVQLEVVVHDQGLDADVAGWIQRVATYGVHVQLLFMRTPEPAIEDEVLAAVV